MAVRSPCCVQACESPSPLFSRAAPFPRGRDRSGLDARRPHSTPAAAASDRGSGTLSAAISNAVVGLLHDYTGRGPTMARTTIGADTIVVTLRDSLTKAERTLADRG
ncbi:MAG: DUF2294 domain-containing protein [Actinobacteria bacterium]|nr:DUF2294 domain-containing protein [Actinomycetota bacterium]